MTRVPLQMVPWSDPAPASVATARSHLRAKFGRDMTDVHRAAGYTRCLHRWRLAMQGKQA